MINVPVEPGYYHNVRSEQGCTVVQTLDDGRTVTDTVPANESTAVFAYADTFVIDDGDALVRQVFKLAPYQKLRLLGVVGGNSGLPTGYTRLEYLESNGNQVINSKYSLTQQTGLFSKSFSVFGNRQTMGTKYVSPPCPRLINYGPRSISAIWNDKTLDLLIPLPRAVIVEGWINWKNSKTARAVSELGEQIIDLEGIAEGGGIYIFQGASRWYGKIYKAAICDGDIIVREYIPSLDPTGAPCLFDIVTRTPFFNSGTGAFIAGIETQQQFNAMLRKLPDRTGQDVGTLQVRLAADLQTPENEAKLDAMQAKNWEISQAA